MRLKLFLATIYNKVLNSWCEKKSPRTKMSESEFAELIIIQKYSVNS